MEKLFLEAFFAFHELDVVDEQNIHFAIPAFKNRGGLRLNPTPSGVPVAITSPARSSVTLDMYSISFATEKIIVEKEACCIVSPDTNVVSDRFSSGPTSSGVTKAGPIELERKKFLP